MKARTPNWKKVVPARLRGERGAAAPATKPHVAALPPVILLHGLGVPRVTMALLAWRLRRRFGRRVYNLPFNTRTHDIPDCADLVARQLREMQIKHFDAVTHSTGAIILRWAMNHCQMPRLRRAVLISPPNAGAWSAEASHRRFGALLPLLFGDSVLQLRPGDLGIAANAGRLEGVEVGIIAGGSGTPRGLRNLHRIPGDNDGVVAVEETILPGMRDFILVPHDHAQILIRARTAQLAELFFETGLFRPRQANEHDHHGEEDPAPPAASAPPSANEQDKSQK